MTIRTGAKTIAGEIDVVVVYGAFVLIGQAKSKRVTLKARAGDSDALATDFKGALQDPYAARGPGDVSSPTRYYAPAPPKVEQVRHHISIGERVVVKPYSCSRLQFFRSANSP